MFNRLGCLVAVASVVLVSAPVGGVDHFGNWPAGKSPREVGARVTENFLRRPHMPMWEDTVVHYAEAVAWYGALTYARAAGDAVLQARTIERSTGRRTIGRSSRDQA